MLTQEGLTIVREFNASRELVWKTFTTSEIIQKWFGPKGYSSPKCEIDLRPGGKYLYAMQSPEGNIFYSAGTVDEIIPMEKLVCTDYFADKEGNKIDPTSFGFNADFPKQMKVIQTFEDAGKGKTKVTIHYPLSGSEAERKAIVDVQMEEGWESSLDKVAEIL